MKMFLNVFALQCILFLCRVLWSKICESTNESTNYGKILILGQERTLCGQLCLATFISIYSLRSPLLTFNVTFNTGEVK